MLTDIFWTLCALLALTMLVVIAVAIVGMFQLALRVHHKQHSQWR